MADLAVKEADKTKRIADIQKSITKNTSASTLQSKMRQIEGYQRDLVKITSDKADVNKKMAEKRKKRVDAAVNLQKAEATEGKKAMQQQKKLQDAYNRQIADLTSQLNARPIIPNIKEQSVYSNSTHNEEYDVFISHATEDKKSFSDDFVKILQDEYNLKVWYDTLSISWGDSIRAKIDAGLKQSKFGVVLLSRSYIKKHWTQYELEGLFQRESNGGKLILPIWHDITKQEVHDFSPVLAGKMAMNTAIMTAHEIADNLVKLVDESK